MTASSDPQDRADSSRFPNSDRLLDRLLTLHPKVIDLSLDRVLRLLGDLGHPQDRLPPVVHVAGTNGKGSTVAFLRAILQAHGYRVHAFTSPHLVRFHERIVLAGHEIDEATLVQVLDRCEVINAGRPITFFEITTAAAFIAFANTPADVSLLETGLGGRLDATNVVSRPALTVLTPIAMDHQAFLGESLAKIAFEKAGILKRDVPCVMARQPSEADAVIRATMATLNVPVLAEGRDWSVVAEGDGLVYTSGSLATRLPSPVLAGGFQVANAGLAVASAQSFLGPRIDWKAVGDGLRQAVWAGRLQPLRSGPLRRLLPANWELWLDGGHNPDAARVLSAELAGWAQIPWWREDAPAARPSPMPTHLVVGMLHSKDAAGFLAPLLPLVKRLITVAIPDAAASFSAEDIAGIAHTLGATATAAAGIEDALKQLAVEETGPARVLICGSLYLAGAVLALNEKG